MKKWIAKGLFLAAMLIAIFGFTAMNHSHHHGKEVKNCIAQQAHVTQCPSGNILDAIVFHISALKNFTLGTFQKAIFLVFLLVLVFPVFYLFRIKKIIEKWPIPFLNLHIKEQALIPLTFEEKTRSWIAQKQKKEPAYF